MTVPPRSSRRRLALGFFVLAIALCLVGVGGSHPLTRALVLGCAGIGIAATAWGSAARDAVMIERVVATCVLVGIPALVAWLPLPGALCSPLLGGDPTWCTASIDPWSAVDWAAKGALVAAVVALGCLARPRRRELTAVMAMFTGTILLLALLPNEADSTGYFGLAPVRLYGPFPNANHFGSALLLTVPFWIRQALAGRLLGLGFAVATPIAILASGALAPAAVLGLLVVATLWVCDWKRTAVVIALGGAIAALPALSYVDPGLNGRVGAWRDLLPMLGDHWWAGTGPGTFARAFSPYRTDAAFHVWNHAHSEPIHHLAETGLVGLFTATLAGLLWLPLAGKGTARDRVLVLGALGPVLHSLLDFPLQTPVIAAMTLFLVAHAGSRAGAGHGLSTGARRALLGFVCLVAVLAGADQARRAAARWAPTTPWIPAWVGFDSPSFAMATWSAADEVDDALRRWPFDARVASEAARWHARHGEPDRSRALADEAVRLAPWDARAWLLRAQVHDALGGLEAAEAWADAIVRLEPKHTRKALERGWRHVPVAVFWLDALEDAPGGVTAQLAKFLLSKRELEAVILAHEQRTSRGGMGMPELAARAHEALGDPDQAERTLRGAAERDPRWQAPLVDLLERRGDYASAEPILRELASRRPEYRHRWYQALGRVRPPEEVAALLREAHGRGDHLDAKTRLVWAHMERRAGKIDACSRIASHPEVQRVLARRGGSDICTKSPPP